MKPIGPRAFPCFSALFATAVGIGSLAAGSAEGQEARKPGGAPLGFSKAVICKKVDGFDRFVPLPDAALTSEDKLVVYYRPINFKVEPVEKPKPGHRYRAKFAQDGRIRRKGEKTALQKKDLIVEYEPTFETPFERIYLVNNVGLKGLPTGDYEYDIVLHDGLDEGSTATQTLSFTIIPIPNVDPPAREEKPGESEDPPGPKSRSKNPKKPAKSP